MPSQVQYTHLLRWLQRGLTTLVLTARVFKGVIESSTGLGMEIMLMGIGPLKLDTGPGWKSVVQLLFMNEAAQLICNALLIQ